MQIFIPGNVPSSKNSKVWTGRFLVESKATKNYRKSTEAYFMQNRLVFKKMFSGLPPFQVGLYFVRKSKHHFDYINACQILADIMVEAHWIVDDNADFFVPNFLGYENDTKNPGVYIVPVSSRGNYEVLPDYSVQLGKETAEIRHYVRSTSGGEDGF